MDINERFLLVMRHFGLNKGEFAERIGASQGVISHLTSGRNKPGLELAINLLQEFEEISSDWLLLGKGEMLKPKQETSAQATDLLKLINEAKVINEMNYNNLNDRLDKMQERLNSR